MPPKEPFHRRKYQKPLQELKMPAHYFGFTNRILQQNLPKGKFNLFIPVYAILKVKSIQGIDVGNLTSQLNSVIIINILIQDLPKPLVHLLSEQIEIQINRSQVLVLKEDRDNNISLDKDSKMLKFTVRKTLSTTINEDTIWSPFQIIRLVASLTFNSIKKEGTCILREYLEHQQKKQKVFETAQVLTSTFGLKVPPKSPRKKPPIDFDQFRSYNISFNCMRNGLDVPISYSLGCVYSLYDLAQRQLEVYHTNCDSYSEVIQKYKNPTKKSSSNQSVNTCKKGKDSTACLDEYSIFVKEQDNKKQLLRNSLDIFSRMYQQKEKKKDLPKPKYSQYSHFIIPLYKYPGNALATIFIPVFLLSLLSLAIFFQQNELSNRIGSIATMVLGYISLIPSIKGQLPPSSRITVIQIVIYISTLCCLFSLVQSFLIDNDISYQFIWYQNKLFLFCLFIHMSIFIFIAILMLMHKLIWQPSYNIEVQARKTDPKSNPQEWINFYCDQQFYKTNQKIYKINCKNKDVQQKTSNFITKYKPIYDQTWEPPKKQENITPNPVLLTFRSHNKNQNVVEGDKEKKQEENKRIEEDKPPIKKKQKIEPQNLEYQKLLNILDNLISQDQHIELLQDKKEEVKAAKQPPQDKQQKAKAE